MKSQTIDAPAGALTEDQERQLRQVKARLPFRIAYATLHPDTGEFFVGAARDMRQPNKAARAGLLVFTL